MDISKHSSIGMTCNKHTYVAQCNNSSTPLFLSLCYFKVKVTNGYIELCCNCSTYEKYCNFDTMSILVIYTINILTIKYFPVKHVLTSASRAFVNKTTNILYVLCICIYLVLSLVAHLRLGFWTVLPVPLEDGWA